MSKLCNLTWPNQKIRMNARWLILLASITWLQIFAKKDYLATDCIPALTPSALLLPCNKKCDHSDSEPSGSIFGVADAVAKSCHGKTHRPDTLIQLQATRQFDGCRPEQQPALLSKRALPSAMMWCLEETLRVVEGKILLLTSRNIENSEFLYALGRSKLPQWLVCWPLEVSQPRLSCVECDIIALVGDSV